MDLYKYFVGSYIASSVSCFCIEMIWPTVRTKQISRHEIVENTKKIIPVVGQNMAVAIPYFLVFEKYLVNNTHTQFEINGILDFFLWWILFIFYAFYWLILTDILFYSFHRAFHHPKLYWLHAKHHSYRYTHGVGAIYASVPDFVLTILVSGSVPIYILAIPYDYSKIIIVLSSFYTVLVSHSGFKYFESHLLHHLKYKVNYGLVFTDKLFSTYNQKQIENNK